MGLLLIDVGRGTQDILYTRHGRDWENSIQLILPSPTMLLAAKVHEASARGEDLLFCGETMGGGPLTAALRRHLAEGGRAWATPLSALTFDDDPEEVEAMGVTVVEEGEKSSLLARQGICPLQTGDVNLDALSKTFTTWGMPFPLHSLAVAVQDHGRAPRGMSDRRFRFQKLQERLDVSRKLSGLSYTGESLPGYLTRMQGVKRFAAGKFRLLVMDTGMAALLGSLADPQVAKCRRKLLLNVGNGHTLAGLVEGDEVIGLVEHHTAALDAGRLQALLDGLVTGEVGDRDVYEDGGHGAFLWKGASFTGWEGVELFAATGPRRALTDGMREIPWLAAPYGQMMLTGNFGLYRAFEECFGGLDGESAV